jgi:hypothetical protein
VDSLSHFDKEQFLRVPLGIVCDIRRAWDKKIKDD